MGSHAHRLRRDAPRLNSSDRAADGRPSRRADRTPSAPIGPIAAALWPGRALDLAAPSPVRWRRSSIATAGSIWHLGNEPPSARGCSRRLGVISGVRRPPDRQTKARSEPESGRRDACWYRIPDARDSRVRWPSLGRLSTFESFWEAWRDPIRVLQPVAGAQDQSRNRCQISGFTKRYIACSLRPKPIREGSTGVRP